MAGPRITQAGVNAAPIVPVNPTGVTQNTTLVVQLSNALERTQMIAANALQQNRQLSTSITQLEERMSQQDAIILQGVLKVNALTQRMQRAEEDSTELNAQIMALQQQIRDLTLQRDEFKAELAREREIMAQRIEALNQNSSEKLGELAQLMTDAVRNNGALQLPQERKESIQNKFGESIGNQIIQSMDQAAERQRQAEIAQEQADRQKREQIEGLQHQISGLNGQMATDALTRANTLKEEADRKIEAFTNIISSLGHLIFEAQNDQSIVMNALSPRYEDPVSLRPSMVNELEGYFRTKSYLAYNVSLPHAQLQQIIALKNERLTLLNEQRNLLNGHKNRLIRSKNELPTTTGNSTACYQFQVELINIESILTAPKQLIEQEKVRYAQWKVHLQQYESHLKTIESNITSNIIWPWYMDSPIKDFESEKANEIVFCMRRMINNEIQRIDLKLQNFHSNSRTVGGNILFPHEMRQWKLDPNQPIKLSFTRQSPSPLNTFDKASINQKIRLYDAISGKKG